MSTKNNVNEIFISADELQAEIDKQLEAGTNSLPPQSDDEKDKLKAFEDSFEVTPEAGIKTTFT